MALVSLCQQHRQPYDEVGITLNNVMTGQFKSWSCAKPKTTFGTFLQQYGCAPMERRSGITLLLREVAKRDSRARRVVGTRPVIGSCRKALRSNLRVHKRHTNFNFAS